MFQKISDHVRRYRSRARYFSSLEFFIVAIILISMKEAPSYLHFLDASYFAGLTEWNILLFSILSGYIYGIVSALENKTDKN